MLEAINIQKKTKKQQAEEIISFLNHKAGRCYRPTKVNTDFIVARLNEGYTQQECNAVIAMKCREWKHDEVWKKYLRPATLFNCEKFNQYAGELEV